MDNATFQRETTTVLAGAATFNGLARSAGEPPTDWAYFVAESYSDQAGTLFVDKSIDGTTWTPCNGTAGLAVAANVTGTVKCNVVARYYRARYVNGATLQGTFVLDTSFTAA